MSMVVRSNLNAMNANRNLSKNNGQVSKSLEKLASGYAINRAGDDAAGLAISEKMKAQIKGLEQASDNSQDGISLVQTAEGGMNEIHNILNRMVELSTKSANGTIQDEVDRDAIQSEVTALKDEIDRIAESTNFNGINLLNGELDGGVEASVGIVNTDGIAGGVTSTPATVSSTTGIVFDAGVADEDNTVIITANIDGESVAIEIEWNADDATGLTANEQRDAFIEAAKENSDFAAAFDIDTDGNITAKDTTGSDSIFAIVKTEGVAFATDPTIVPGVTSSTSATIANGDVISVDDKTFIATTDSTLGGTADADGATYVYGSDATSMANAMSNALNNAGANTSVDASGNLIIDTSNDTVAVAGEGTNLTLQIGDTGEDFNMVSVSIQSMKTTSLGIDHISVATQEDSQNAIDYIKEAVNKVSENRANLGAVQNRLEYTINNLDNTAENMTSANSTIRDTDMASEMMEYTKMNVLTQSAQSMLAQANQAPQQILSLLG